MSSTPTSSARLALDAEGRVAINLPCVGCGYNVRTLLHDAVCPECARPVVESLSGGFLRYADPDWVKGLGRGLLLVLIASITGVLLPGLAVRIVAATSLSGAGRTIAIDIAVSLTVSLAILLAILGLHWLTRRNPAADPRREGWSARRMTRWSSWLLAAVPLYWLAVLTGALCNAGLDQSGSSPLSIGMLVCVFSKVAVVAACCVTPIVLMRHLMVLLRRIPRPGLARFAQIEFWVLLIVSPLMVIGYVFAMFALMPTMAGATTLFFPPLMPGITGSPPGVNVGLLVGGVIVATVCRRAAEVLSLVGLVLLLMAWLALNSAGRDAAACAAEAARIAPSPEVSPPSDGVDVV